MAMKSDIVLISLQDRDDFEKEFRERQDELLDLYSLYRETGLSCIKEELLLKAYELHLLDPQFTFHI